jgi:hypothetical protein
MSCGVLRINANPEEKTSATARFDFSDYLNPRKSAADMICG